MSNPRNWRGKGRTTKPNSRQKRNGLFLDAYPTCQRCRAARSVEAHHRLPRRHAERYDWAHMQALCTPCHIAVHQAANVVVVINLSV